MKIQLLFVSAILLFALQVFSQNFELDTGFASQGKLQVAGVTLGTMGAMAVAVQNDGKIVVLGGNLEHGGLALMLSRYNPDGSIDHTFGVDGRVVTQLTGYLHSMTKKALCLQPDGKILICGGTYSAMPMYFLDFSVARYNSDGTLDSSFGQNGIFKHSYSGLIDFAYAVTLQQDGRIVAVGTVSQAIDNNSYAIFRLDSNGSPDPTFGVNGGVLVSFPNLDQDPSDKNYANAVAIQQDGKILVGGGTKEGSTKKESFGLVRLNSDGSLDAGFGSGGLVMTSFPGTFGSRIESLTVLPDQTIIAAGNNNLVESQQQIVLAKYDSNGTVATDFGVEGLVVTQFGTSDWDSIYDLKSLPNGKLLGCGNASNIDQGIDFLIVQYNADGTIDNGFAANGIIAMQHGDGNETLNAMAFQQDGKVLFAGESSFYSEEDPYDYVIFRFGDGELNNIQMTGDAFKVFPNPFTNYIDIFLDGVQERSSFELFDITGRNISSKFGQTHFSEEHKVMRLYLSESLPKGVYLLKIANGEKSTTIKISK